MQRHLTLLLFFAAAPVAQVDDATPAMLWAIQLPALVTEARQAGVTETVVREGPTRASTPSPTTSPRIRRSPGPTPKR